jgi:hypothetical protein
MVRPMGRALRIVLALLLAAACGDDDAPPAADGSAADASILDAGGAADAAERPDAHLGKLCATGAVDGGAGACDPGSTCCTHGSTVCTLIEDCPTGPGYVACSTSGGCPGGRVCCRVGSDMFCTKADACADYAGMVIP